MADYSAEKIVHGHCKPNEAAGGRGSFRPIHSFTQAISIAPLPVHYYSEVLPTQHEYCVGVSHQRATGNCK